jgi:molybdate transport system substrate-binding protein
MRLAARLLVAGLLGLLLGGGCRQDTAPADRPQRPELLLFCGAGLRPPLDVLVEEFSRAEGVSIVVDYAGSEVLLSKIKLSGQGDLYLPGDNRYVDGAAAQGLIASRRSVCWFLPVILVSKGNPKQIRGLADLTREDVRVGLGDPRACSVGVVSRELFQKNNLPWETVERSVAFQAATVNELGMQVQTGALDAVIVWDAVAKQYAEHADEVSLPLAENIVSAVDLAVLSSSRHAEVAQRFTEFAGSSRGQQVFRQHGYLVNVPGLLEGASE